MQEVFEKIIKELRELKVKITAESQRVPETDNDCIFDKSDILDERAAGVVDALKVVRRILREYNNGWIFDRMPKEKETVIVSTEKSSFAGCYFCGEWYRENMFCYDSMIRETDVIAWQPLPQPYEPKED